MAFLKYQDVPNDNIVTIKLLKPYNKRIVLRAPYVYLAVRRVINFFIIAFNTCYTVNCSI